MTASITIVNTSNWDGEDFRIRPRAGQTLGEGTKLRPGESMVLHPGIESDGDMELSLQKDFVELTKPIHAPGVIGRTRHDGQVCPKVRVTFEK